MRSIGVQGAVRGVLSDGEWHDVLEIVERVGDMITPEVAARTWMQQARATDLDDRSLIYVIHKGRRLVIVKAIYSIRKHHEIEMRRHNRKITSVRMK